MLDLPQRELGKWYSYWIAEPWGAWRDNYHTAIIVSELLRPHIKDAPVLGLDRFMYKDPRAVKRARVAKIGAYMNAAAKQTERKLKRKGK